MLAGLAVACTGPLGESDEEKSLLRGASNISGTWKSSEGGCLASFGQRKQLRSGESYRMTLVCSGEVADTGPGTQSWGARQNVTVARNAGSNVFRVCNDESATDCPHELAAFENGWAWDEIKLSSHVASWFQPEAYNSENDSARTLSHISGHQRAATILADLLSPGDAGRFFDTMSNHHRRCQLAVFRSGTLRHGVDATLNCPDAPQVHVSLDLSITNFQHQNLEFQAMDGAGLFVTHTRLEGQPEQMTSLKFVQGDLENGEYHEWLSQTTGE